jgi:hypothetical protein
MPSPSLPADPTLDEIRAVKTYSRPGPDHNRGWCVTNTSGQQGAQDRSPVQPLAAALGGAQRGQRLLLVRVEQGMGLCVTDFGLQAG